jgi:hypothetical protein
MSFGQDFNPFMPPFAAKREIRVRETELIHTLILTRTWNYAMIGTDLAA